MYRYLLIIFLACFAIVNAGAQPKKYSFSRSKMGSPFNIILVADDSLKAAALAEKCYALVDSFDLIYSDYNLKSELSRINGISNREHKTSPALWDILTQSRHAFRKSKGGFDITVGSLSQLWRKCRKEKRFPSVREVSQQKKQVGFARLRLDTLHQTVFLPAGMRFDLGGIAKGYIAQQVIDFLRTQNIHQALADAGGDIVMSGPPPDSEGWKIGVNLPETTDDLWARRLVIRDMAVASSGDAYQFIKHNGKIYSHIIDPRTGYGISSRRNVTVIAPDGATADWLATACSILPVTKAKELALQNGAELLITELVSGKLRYHLTPGFRNYWKNK